MGGLRRAGRFLRLDPDMGVVGIVVSALGKPFGIFIEPECPDALVPVLNLMLQM